jgi:uncharacterized OB-fold protein
MAILKPQTGDIPRPVPTITSRPFWEGTKRGELLFQRCTDCGGATWSPAVMCSHCWSTNLTWEASKGEGEVYSWTSIWRPQTPAFEVPYVAIVVRMDEGYDFLSNIVGCEVDDVHIGMRVKVQFHALDDTTTLPYFVPAT